MKIKELFILEEMLILMAGTNYPINRLERLFMEGGRIKAMNSSLIKSNDQRR